MSGDVLDIGMPKERGRRRVLAVLAAGLPLMTVKVRRVLRARLREISYAPLRIVVRDPRSLAALVLRGTRSVPSDEVTLKDLALSPETRIEFNANERANLELLLSSQNASSQKLSTR